MVKKSEIKFCFFFNEKNNDLLIKRTWRGQNFPATDKRLMGDEIQALSKMPGIKSVSPVIDKNGFVKKDVHLLLESYPTKKFIDEIAKKLKSGISKIADVNTDIVMDLDEIHRDLKEGWEKTRLIAAERKEEKKRKKIPRLNSRQVVVLGFSGLRDRISDGMNVERARRELYYLVEASTIKMDLDQIYALSWLIDNIGEE